jgi:hypothetical protein
MTTGTFGDFSQESYGTTLPYQVQSERPPPVKAHAHTCTSILNPDDPTVEKGGPPGKVTGRQDDEITDLHPLCLCNKSLSQGSCKDGSNYPSALQKSPGDQMDVTGVDGLNDTPLLAPVLESDNPPLPLRGTPGKTRDYIQKMVTPGRWEL